MSSVLLLIPQSVHLQISSPSSFFRLRKSDPEFSPCAELLIRRKNVLHLLLAYLSESGLVYLSLLILIILLHQFFYLTILTLFFFSNASEISLPGYFHRVISREACITECQDLQPYLSAFQLHISKESALIISMDLFRCMRMCDQLFI